MKRKHGSSAFTLIEMLVVMTIIGIIAGMVFKMLGYAGREALKADTVKILECVANALNEYRAEYGQYPPVTKVRYEFEDKDRQRPWLRNNYFDRPAAWAGGGGAPVLFSYGLVSYLAPREKLSVVHKHSFDNVPENVWGDGESWRYIEDTARDKEAKVRWSHFLDGLVSDDSCPRSTIGDMMYTNGVDTICDAWERDIYYESDPPHLTYKLWSAGADGASGTSDDVHLNKWDN